MNNWLEHKKETASRFLTLTLTLTLEHTHTHHNNSFDEQKHTISLICKQLYAIAFLFCFHFRHVFVYWCVCVCLCTAFFSLFYIFLFFYVHFRVGLLFSLKKRNVCSEKTQHYYWGSWYLRIMQYARAVPITFSYCSLEITARKIELRLRYDHTVVDSHIIVIVWLCEFGRRGRLFKIQKKNPLHACVKSMVSWKITFAKMQHDLWFKSVSFLFFSPFWTWYILIDIIFYGCQFVVCNQFHQRKQTFIYQQPK